MKRSAYLTAGVAAAVLLGWLAIVRPLGSSASAGLPAHLLFARVSYPDKETIYLATPKGKREVERRLTGPNGYFLAGISPDHSRILAISGGDIPPPPRLGTVRLNGQDFKRLRAPDPTLNLLPCCWSPDETRLAFMGWDDTNPARTGIYTANAADGTGLTRVTTRPGRLLEEALDYTPDGKWLLFYQDTHPDPDPAVGGSLWVVRVDGSDLHRITGTSRPPADWARWSPAGDRILYADERTAPSGAIWTVRPDGTHRTKVFADKRGRFPITPAWSPDEKQIVFALDPTNDQFTHPPNQLYVMNADGSHLHLLIGDHTFKRNPEWW
jgi:Tol biopolymer transport system component